jgi:protein-tyrosine phosphatase
MDHDQAEPDRLHGIRTGQNFRDLGGYRTEEGRRVKWRTVFRSGAMGRIDSADTQTLRSLGIATIFDLRTNAERRRDPTIWHRACGVTLIEHDNTVSAGALHDLIRGPETDAESLRAVMRDVYRTLPYEQAQSYTRLFHCLAAGALPLIFNCAAGKDRTGIAAALLLSLLGVPRPTIMADYLITNDFIAGLTPILAIDPLFGPLLRDRPQVALPLLRAEAEYLETMFATIEARHGGTDAYLRDTLGVTPKMAEELRLRLLN